MTNEPERADDLEMQQANEGEEQVQAHSRDIIATSLFFDEYFLEGFSPEDEAAFKQQFTKCHRWEEHRGSERARRSGSFWSI